MRTTNSKKCTKRTKSKPCPVASSFLDKNAIDVDLDIDAAIQSQLPNTSLSTLDETLSLDENIALRIDYENGRKKKNASTRKQTVPDCPLLTPNLTLDERVALTKDFENGRKKKNANTRYTPQTVPDCPFLTSNMTTDERIALTKDFENGRKKKTASIKKSPVPARLQTDADFAVKNKKRHRMLKKVFTLADFDENKKLTVTELKASFDGLERPYFDEALDHLDLNGDQAIDAKEFAYGIGNWQNSNSMFIDDCLLNLENATFALRAMRRELDLSTKKTKSEPQCQFLTSNLTEEERISLEKDYQNGSKQKQATKKPKQTKIASPISRSRTLSFASKKDKVLVSGEVDTTCDPFKPCTQVETETPEPEPKPTKVKQADKTKRISVHLALVGSRMFDRYIATFHKDRGLIEFRICPKYQQSDEDIQFLAGTGRRIVVQPSLEAHSIKHIYKGKSRNLAKWLNWPYKCPTYGDLTDREGNVYIFGMYSHKKAEFERLWSSLLMDNISRKFIDGTASKKQSELFQYLWKRHGVNGKKYGKKW